MTANQRALASQILEMAACPIDWAAVAGRSGQSCYLLRLEWWMVYRDFGLSVEDIELVRLVAKDGSNDLVLDHIASLESLASILCHRSEKAKSSYMSGLGRLNRVRFVPPGENGKHWKAGWKPERVVSDTRLRPSLFFKDYRPEQLAGAFWSWFAEYFAVEFGKADEQAIEILSSTTENKGKLWNQFRTLDNFRIAFDCLANIGASRGHETQLVCFDLHLAAGIAHAYPVSQDEAKDIMAEWPLIAVDDLQGA